MEELNVALRKQERLVLGPQLGACLLCREPWLPVQHRMDQTLLRSQYTGRSGKVILSKFEVSLDYIRKRIIIRERKTNKQKHKKGPEFPDWKMKPTWFSTYSSAFFSNPCRISFC